MNTKTALAALLAGLFLVPAVAQTAPGTNTPRVDKRQEKQDKRIDQGVASGQLNTKEAARLEAGQARVDAAEDKAKADGKVTAKERAKLTHKQNKQNRRIAKQKHDAQVAPAAPAN
ncbi:MAG: hypothetical protein JNK75_13830 [Betaproteobacteria bacterium]|nr:hypothetical protein [Betaproteobacteria bacterium]